ncbi:2342_t:CDS:2, partial [Scutellospora calospora]
LHLASAGTSYRGIDILANTELTVLSKTILRYKQQIVSYSSLELSKFDNIDNLTIHLYDNTILEHKNK